MLEVVMQSSWFLASLIEHKGGYGSRLFAGEEHSLLDMQVPWDEQQEQKEQDSTVNQSL